MSARAVSGALFAALLLVLALSTGERLYLLLALVLWAMFLLALASSLWARATLRLTSSLSTESVTHGASLILRLRAAHRGLLPIAPIQLSLAAPAGEEILRVSVPAFREKSTVLSVFCPHVGRFDVGVRSVRVEDVFGLFSFSAKAGCRLWELLVLPKPEPVPALRFSPGEYDSEVISRATEDSSSPSGVRGYQQGDELKKVHWKLSLRKREILVKTYDQPMRPDALVLLDCMPPATGDAAPDIQDRLCDLAASIGALLLEADALLRMPLTGEPPEEVTLTRGGTLSPVFTALARMGFRGSTRFERVLQLECRRMRRQGATVVLTSRLSPLVTDLILRLKRMGPFVRVYLVTNALEEGEQTLVQRLIRNDVECVVERLP